MSEFVYHDIPLDDIEVREMPVLAGMEAVVASQ